MTRRVPVAIAVAATVPLAWRTAAKIVPLQSLQGTPQIRDLPLVPALLHLGNLQQFQDFIHVLQGRSQVGRDLLGVGDRFFDR